MSSISPVVDLVTQSEQPGQALVPASGLVLMLERLAANPNVSVEALERMIAMQERILRYEAEAAFNAAFVEMQPDIPTIIEKARTDKTAYAPLEDIIEVIRPIYSRHGFTLGFQTEWPGENKVKVIGILTHRQGHARRSEFVSLADQTGSKNAIQALASTVSYGKRYTTKDLFCIVTREDDDDGEKSSKAGKKDVTVPAGFDDWLADLRAVADEGTKRLEATWKASRLDLRNHLIATDKKLWESLKAKAASVKAS